MSETEKGLGRESVLENWGKRRGRENDGNGGGKRGRDIFVLKQDKRKEKERESN